MNSTSAEDARLGAIKAAIEAAGWNWRPGKSIPYGTQLIVVAGDAEATLDFYPKRGRSVVGGAHAELRQALTALAADLEGAPAPVGKVAPIGGAQIGMDESGKGDWYGPLVVAAVYLEPGQEAALRRAGVRDSKELSGEEVARVAAAIEAVVPVTARQVTALAPEEYNRRYAGYGNVNLLLADLYAETAIPVQQATGARKIVCDQFAQRTDRLDRAFAAAGLPKPTQLHHAEAASLAVAAASVLATARFAAELARLGAEAGLGRSLPAGSSAISLLQKAARQIMARDGRDGLGRYAKLNFKPVQEMLGG